MPKVLKCRLVKSISACQNSMQVVALHHQIQVPMTDSQAKEYLQQVEDIYAAEGYSVEKMVPLLKAARERTIETKDPLATKILRMTYEHLEEHNDFLIKYLEEGEAGEINNFQYMISLLKDSGNAYNREEMKEFRDYLKLYPEIPEPDEVDEPEAEA